MAGLSGIVKKISDLVTGTPADDDCFIFGKTDLKKITLEKLKDALGITSLNSALAKIHLYNVSEISFGYDQNAYYIEFTFSEDNKYRLFCNQTGIAFSYWNGSEWTKLWSK